MPSQSNKKRVVVTGFAPFGVHKVNSSWIAVQELHKIGVGEGVDLVIMELPVEYTTVKESVPALWQEHKPDLVVHVGVSGIASELTLEQQAHNDGYDTHDVCGCVPDRRLCVDGADTSIKSAIDMQQICEEVNESCSKIKAVVSHDAGRYLCDFSYFLSLHADKTRAAFIHVPVLNSPYSAGELAEGLRHAIVSMLRQVSEIPS